MQGAAIVLTGFLLAATNAFFLSRGVGKTLAQKVIAFEMAPEPEAGGKGPAAHNPVGQKLLEVW